MKKSTALWLSIFVMFTIVSWQARGAEDDKTLSVVADSWCPYNCDPTSKYAGYIVEILHAVFEPAGYQIKYNKTPWTRAIQGTRNGKYDIIIGAYRSDAPDFIFPKNPVGASQNVMARRKNDPWTYRGVGSLKDQAIAIVDGYSFGEELDVYLNNSDHNVIKLHGEDALRRALNMIRGATLHGVLDDANVLSYKIVDQGLEAVIALSNPIGDKKAVFVAFAPNIATSLERAKIFDEGLMALRSSGALDKILSRYQLEDWQ